MSAEFSISPAQGRRLLPRQEEHECNTYGFPWASWMAIRYGETIMFMLRWRPGDLPFGRDYVFEEC